MPGKLDPLACLSFGLKFANKKRKRTDAPINLEKVETDASPPSKVRAKMPDEQIVAPEDEDRQMKTDDVAEPSVLSGSALGISETCCPKIARRRKKSNSAANVHLEKVRALRKENRIYVWGDDINDPISDFDGWPLDERLRTALVKAQFASPTPVQMQTLPLLMQRREILVSAPTGSGKTLAFALPLIQQILNSRNAKPKRRRRIWAVVLEPTRELTRQVATEFERLCDGLPIRVCCVPSEPSQLVADLGAGPCDILVSTPNRLVYALKDAASVHALRLDLVRWLLVDESDRLFEAGDRGFREQLAAVYRACKGARVRRALFSATFSYEVEEWCKANLTNVAMVCVGPRNSAVGCVRQELVYASTEYGKLVAMRRLLAAGLPTPALVFVQSKQRADELYSELVYGRVSVGLMHGQKEQAERDKQLQAFRDGSVAVLICTELMGRGMDIKAVNLVINYDLPSSPISYIHRIGRTGRAGAEGRAITFFTDDDRRAIRAIADVIKGSGSDVADYLLQLPKPPRRLKAQLLHAAPKRRKIATSKAMKTQRRVKRKLAAAKTPF